LPSGEAWVMKFGGLNFPVIQTTAPDKGKGSGPECARVW
jgi:hypothetical protein